MVPIITINAVARPYQVDVHPAKNDKLAVVKSNPILPGLLLRYGDFSACNQASSSVNGRGNISTMLASVPQIELGLPNAALPRTLYSLLLRLV